ncbi:SDR family oxidoreductase [Hymenobacter cavernae]|uniref:Dihydroflavonol-4-reductase n=1 Tax=Hymenobacter cavernae TaxID=2044852 RepID=A0ABQ1URE6_9BACT|nr:aldehyde reductase [Hymenobacter cavernae]GGF23291.1 dihydroflavonol-4-reductase [Hymenobacter cavernae]
MKGKVLLTGISGFIGSHTAIHLLENGYEVTGTLRSLDRADAVKTMLARHTQHVDKLRFAQAELTDETVWHDLMQGMDYVQHIASPNPREVPQHEDELIVPAKNGVLHVLRAAAANGVKRVVLTSSTGALMYGRPKGRESGLYDETTWTDVTNRVDTTAYFRSKTLAEKAAWDFMAADTSELELTAVLPGLVLGPVLEEDFGNSANAVLKLLDGSMPAVPDLGFALVDVRSIADLLRRAMEQPAAAGQRFVGTAGFLTYAQIAALLRTRFPGRNIPRRVLPNLLTRLLSWFDPAIRPVLLDLGQQRKCDNRKAKELLHWQPLTQEEAVIACAQSILDLGLVK